MNHSLLEQTRLGEALNRYAEKENTVSYGYIYDTENRLIDCVRSGDLKTARALLNDLLGYVLFCRSEDTDVIRIHSIELTAVLTRIAVNAGTPPDSAYNLSNGFYTRIFACNDIDDICFILQDMVRSFTDIAFFSGARGNTHLRKALIYMNEHYSEPITLSDAAAAAGISAAHLSSLFSDTLGSGFREQLMKMRIDAGKRLLESTEASLSDIAFSLGFADQSHFCRVFRHLTGTTPGKYRNPSKRIPSSWDKAL